MLDDAVAYVAQDSRPAAERLLVDALDTASSLDTFSERGRVVPELNQPDVRELLEMALSEMQRAQVTKRLTSFCDARVPASVRSKLHVGFRLKANEVVLFEERPSFQPPHEWRELDVAKFKYVEAQGAWRLYLCAVVSDTSLGRAGFAVGSAPTR
jgi:hypothetical protein